MQSATKSYSDMEGKLLTLDANSNCKEMISSDGFTQIDNHKTRSPTKIKASKNRNIQCIWTNKIINEMPFKNYITH